MLKFESLAKVGDTIGAYDFMVTPIVLLSVMLSQREPHPVVLKDTQSKFLQTLEKPLVVVVETSDMFHSKSHSWNTILVSTFFAMQKQTKPFLDLRQLNELGWRNT